MYIFGLLFSRAFWPYYMLFRKENMKEYIDTNTAGDILEYIPSFVKRHAMSNVVIKTSGPENQRGGVEFDITIDGISLRWKVIHNWKDMLTVTYCKPEGPEDFYSSSGDDDLPYTEEMDNSTFISCFVDLQNHMLDSKLMWEEE